MYYNSFLPAGTQRSAAAAALFKVIKRIVIINTEFRKTGVPPSFALTIY
jgi:hypothetical protein